MRKKKLLSFVEEFRSGLLGEKPSDMMCFAVSAPLQAMLSFSGVETELMQGFYDEGNQCVARNDPNACLNHIWLQCEDGTIIDATADQFDGPKVYIGPAIELYANGRPF